jgi:tRNA pseudouridine55 synthase
MEKRVIDGFVVLDKPAGMTSNRALQTVKRLFQAKKAGFVGTLDPFATGMLPICFGRATKLSDALHEHPKIYIATLKLGQATVTGDTEGEISAEAPIPPLSLAEIKAILPEFVGKIQQVPPMFSALKKEGQPLYKLARQGIEVERVPREVAVYALEVLDYIEGRVRFKVQSSKGLYVRVLAEDLAKRLGTVGHLQALYRQECAGFDEAQLVSLETLQAQPDFVSLEQYIQLLPV